MANIQKRQANCDKLTPTPAALRRAHGQLIEKKVAIWLQEQGCELITQNYAYKTGEVDLIICETNTLVFVEIRSKSNSNFGLAEESVDYRKQKKIRSVAEYFLYKHPKFLQLDIRFDVIAINGTFRHNAITWLKDAF